MRFTGILLLPLFFLLVCKSYGQVVTECPQNIGFENGTLNGWTCYTGEISGTGNNFPDAARPAEINVSRSSAVNGTHTLIPRGSGIDPFGGFSLNAPNGSNYVIKLGNEMNGRGAESISFSINVPSNVDSYSVIFNYAVVFENPNHDYDEQPKFTARVIDVENNISTQCGSFEFTAPGTGGGIPGFFSADSILYKPWSPVMVNLSDYRGRSVRLEFTTNDCSRGRHFGYAYIDFNENCSIPITGNITCPDTDALTLKAIPGFAEYRWFNAVTNESLGTGEDVTLSPPPPDGSKIGVELTPYFGLGCTQTLYTTITNMYMTMGTPAPKCSTVDITTTALTVGNSSDLTYTYWKDPQATIPLDRPKQIGVGGTYYVKGSSSSGCIRVLPVTVTITRLAELEIRNPPPAIFPETVDITQTFDFEYGMEYSYWKDAQATIKLDEPKKIRRSGTFYIKKTNEEGCFLITPVNVSVLLPDFFVPNTFTPNGDGINDEFTIIAGGKTAIKKLKIFNRWGKLVYETSNIENYWNGLIDNNDASPGVYYWIIDGEEAFKPFKRSGYITLIR